MSREVYNSQVRTGEIQLTYEVELYIVWGPQLPAAAQV